jgi:hypothetical protein
MYQISVKGLRVLSVFTFRRLYGFSSTRNGAWSNDGPHGRPKQATILNYRWCNFMTVYLINAFEVPLDIKKKLTYKVLIRPVLTYASETWTLSEMNERRLSMFDSKVLRCILGANPENGTTQLLFQQNALVY